MNIYAKTSVVAMIGVFLVPALLVFNNLATLPIAWLLCALLLVIFCALLGAAINNGAFGGLIIDNRNRASLSKLQALAWTVLIMSAFITAVFARLHYGLPAISVTPGGSAADITLPPELLAVMGISATSLVATPVILSTKSGDATAVPPVPSKVAQNAVGGASFLDLFTGDDISNSDNADLSKVQQFLITVVVLVVYGAALSGMFATAAPPLDPAKPTWLNSLPTFNENLAWLIGISHAGYLAYKAAPH
jgi:hypothetical protein